MKKTQNLCCVPSERFEMTPMFSQGEAEQMLDWTVHTHTLLIWKRDTFFSHKEKTKQKRAGDRDRESKHPLNLTLGIQTPESKVPAIKPINLVVALEPTSGPVVLEDRCRGVECGGLGGHILWAVLQWSVSFSHMHTDTCMNTHTFLQRGIYREENLSHTHPSSQALAGLMSAGSAVLFSLL